MKQITMILAICLLVHGADAQDWMKKVNEAQGQAKDIYNKKSGKTSPLSKQEVINGLKEALTVGTNNSSSSASKTDGYYKNTRIAIPFPPDAQEVKEKVETMGMKPQVDKFVMTVNRAAEEAAKEAAPIFIGAVKGMTINDGFKILNGPDDAATSYLKGATSPELKAKFLPVVKRAIEKVEVTRHWKPIITAYNRIPLVKKANPDLEDYITQKAIDGLFLLIADEEKKIRTDPVARVTDLLKKVFKK